MICPNCGYDIGNKSKCLRCGYEIKTLALQDKNDKQKEENDTKVIDPGDTFITQSLDDGSDPFFDVDPFSSLFGDLFGDPISDLLGGLFGIDLNPFGGSRRRVYVREPEEPPKKKKKQGPVVEVDEVEIIEEDPDEDDPPIKK